jgi:glycosyltransferase involved in cell wall biosynthesis
MAKKIRICFISKYPPIEGGVSSLTYWLAKALGKKGHEVHIITNAWEVEAEYREKIDPVEINNQYQPKNVYIHHTTSFTDSSRISTVPGYIPYTNPYTEKLASLAIETINKYDLQLIDSWYILPYGVAGFLAKAITGKPQILRHAGSDLSRLFEYPYLKTLFLSLFKKTDKILTNEVTKDFFLNLNIPDSKLVTYKHHGVDPQAFNPRVAPLDWAEFTGNRDMRGLPVITYIGKVAAAKGIYNLAEAASKIKDGFRLLFICNGKGLQDFKSYVKKLSLRKKVIFSDFLPPWKIPSLIKSSRCIAMLESGFPITEHCSIIPKEVMAMGKCLLLSEELYNKGYYDGMQNGKNTLAVDPGDIDSLKQVLEKVIRKQDYADKIGRQAYLTFRESALEFDKYVEDTAALYRNVLRFSKK